MKRILKSSLSLVLALTIILSSALVGLGEIDFGEFFAVKAEAASESDLTFALNDDGKSYSVSDCNESAKGKLAIPENHNGLSVTSISDRAFENCSNLESVYIHSAVTSMGESVFVGCDNLKTVYYESDEEAWNAIKIGADNEILANTTINYNVSIAQTLFTVKANCVVNNKVTYTVYLNQGVNVYGTVIFAKYDNSVLSPVFYKDGCGAYMVDDGDGGLSENISGMYETGIMTGYSDQVSVAHIYGQDVDYKNGSSNKGYMTFAFEIIGGSFTDTTVGFYCYEFTSKSDPGSDVPNGSGELITELSGDPEHTPSDWIVDKKATCTEDGTKHKECTVCREVLETGTVAKTGHKSSDWITDKNATCTEDGSKNKECTVCGEVLETVVIAKTGHTSSDWIIDKNATCTEDGSKHKECTVCGEVLETVVIAKTGHTSSDWITDKNATCTEDGSKHKECTVCGEVLETVVIAKTGHKSSDWIVDKVATCTEDGSKHKECTVCGEGLETEAIAKMGHVSSDWIIESEPTCTNNGLRYKKCALCDVIIDIETIKANCHIGGDWITDKEPTCTEDGSKHKECTVCGEVLETAVISKTGHRFSDWIIDKNATVDAAGAKHKECTVCKVVLEKATIPQLKCAAPKLTKVESTGSGVKVTWSKTAGADSYIVYRKTYSSGKWSGWSSIKSDVSGSATSYTDTTAKSGVYYIYTVRGVNEAGKGSYNSTGLKIKFLATPKLSSVANGSGKVTVKWGKVAGASSYTVYRKTYSNGKWSGWSKIGTTKNTYYNDTKVSSGKYYKYTVRATSGDYSSYYNTSGLKIKYLAAVSLKSATSQKAGVKVTWSAVSGAKGYEVYRRTYSKGKWSGWTKIKTVSGGSTVSYTDKTAKKGVTYKYTVRAISDSNKGSYNTSGLQVKDKY